LELNYNQKRADFRSETTISLETDDKLAWCTLNQGLLLTSVLVDRNFPVPTLALMITEMKATI